MPFEIISRPDAKAKGLKRFFTAIPCKNGHIAQRYVSGSGVCVECQLEHFRKWYRNNTGHFAIKARRRRKEKPQWYKDSYDRWIADPENYQRKLTHNCNRRSRLLSAGDHTPEESARLLERQHHRCANIFCLIDLRKVDKQLDHIIPLARGGSNRVENLQWLCEPCNRRKYSLDPDVWFDREAERAQQGNDI
jgi:5-methylcytosine-specific restriction endonuclease McrA